MTFKIKYDEIGASKVTHLNLGIHIIKMYSRRLECLNLDLNTAFHISTDNLGTLGPEIHTLKHRFSHKQTDITENHTIIHIIPICFLYILEHVGSNKTH